MPNDHYYTSAPTSAHKEASVEVEYRGHKLHFDTDSGVFSRTELDRGTEVLLDTLEEVSGSVLDMGCGWGIIGVAVGKNWPDTQITMADINQRACALSAANARKNGVAAEVLESDGYEKVLGRSYDLILQNPPIRAGKAVIYQMFADAARCLNPGGELRLVIRKQQGAPSAITYLRTLFDSVETIEKKSGFWIISCRDAISANE
ncbi:MAG: class I SAM-dependent methyltransferase [bacterium]|nr:class I SAM-dependent methyltransferase [bacterium]